MDWRDIAVVGRREAEVTCRGMRASSVPMPAKAAAGPSSREIMRVTQASSMGPAHRKVQYTIPSSNRRTSLLTRFTTCTSDGGETKI